MGNEEKRLKRREERNTNKEEWMSIAVRGL